MGIFDKLVRSGGQSGDSEASVSPARALELYQKHQRDNTKPPAGLLNTLGDMHRDLGEPKQAVDFYERAAFRYIQDENWTLADAATHKAVECAGGQTNNSLLASIEIGLARGLSGNYLSAIDRLASRLRPSDGALIDQLVEVVDRHPGTDLSLQIKVSEVLCNLARPERAVERLYLALRLANRMGRDAVVADIEARLDQLDPARDSLAPRNNIIPQSPSVEWVESPVEERVADTSQATKPAVAEAPDLAVSPIFEAAQSPADEEFVEVAPVGEIEAVTTDVGDANDGVVALRVVGTDARAVDRDEQGVLRELLAQFMAGIDATLTADDVREHFEVGLAFLDMALYDEAIREFQLASRAPSEQVRSAQFLAQAFVQKGEAVLALHLADEILERAGKDWAPEGKVGLWYWKGRAAEQLGEVKEARGMYAQVAMVNMSFEDAHARLKALSL